MTSNRKLIGIVAAFAIAFGFAIHGIFNHDGRVQDLDKNHRYAAAFVTAVDDSYSAANRGKVFQVRYRFSVNGKQMEKRSAFNALGRDMAGRIFIVMFQPEDPSNCRLLTAFPCADSSIVNPPQGWKDVPAECGPDNSLRGR